METTMTLITNLLALFIQVNLVLDRRNLWTLAAMIALLLKGKRAHPYELGKALPCSGKENSRVHKIRRWLTNPRMTPVSFLPTFLRVFAPFLRHLPGITLIIDRTAWHRRRPHLTLFVCSVVCHSRAFPLDWLFLPTRGCSSWHDQQRLRTPVLTALAANSSLTALPRTVLADRACCAPKFATGLTHQHTRFCLRVKKSYRIMRSDLPSTPIGGVFAHCRQNTDYFFDHVRITASSGLQAHLFLSWRSECAEPLALITDLTESTALPTIYHDRIFIDTLHRDSKSGGDDVERGKLTDTKRLSALLIPMTMAYMLTVIHGQLDDLPQARPPLKKRRLSLFARARQLFQEVCDRKPFAVASRFFQLFFCISGSCLFAKHTGKWHVRLPKFLKTTTGCFTMSYENV